MVKSRGFAIVAVMLFAIAGVLFWPRSAVPAALNPSFLKFFHIFSPKDSGKPHGSSLVELPNKDILATWYAATEETNSEAQIFGAVWDNKKWKWGEPYVIIPKGYSKSVGNTTLYLDSEGILWLFFSAVQVGGWSGSNIDYMQSRDGGKTWSEGETLVGKLGHLPRNKPIPLGPNKMLAPFFIDFWYEANMVGSYTMTIDHKDGKILGTKITHLDDHDAIQPSLVELPDGRILMLARDKSSKFIRRSYSKDKGKTWEPMTMTDVPNPGSAVSAIYVKEAKCILLAYNHSHKSSNPLSLAFSLDGGATFTKMVDLAWDRLGKLVAYNYPTLLQTSDGLIHVLWSHRNRESLKHAVFSPLWLRITMRVTLEEKEKNSGN